MPGGIWPLGSHLEAHEAQQQWEERLEQAAPSAPWRVPQHTQLALPAGPTHHHLTQHRGTQNQPSDTLKALSQNTADYLQ